MAQDSYITARANITWGKPADEVLAELRNEGLGDKEALAIINELVAERRTYIRGVGFKKIIRSTFIITPCLVVVVWLVNFPNGSNIYNMFHYIFKVAGVACLFAIYQLCDGLIRFFAPDSIKGDIGMEE